ncbi:hypothetical protein VN12_24280 [Pirellula sp. SH-Sr6A]|uniref:hypothetical protein n=1 Tax=Pirellula sp. SH-Sr6A TaxID=1632865 RepID=UPI00078EED32|nr:hypothetical protein [Pirellula sp. SH-Sr6A]AMV35265.1 hypothetical protein VN12_24280 [Pirellula sp. SH-Sr6A]
MRFVPRNAIANLKFHPHELLFLDCWYGLTHEKSLDSYRVKCLNARTVVHELCDEISKGRIDQPEFQGLCSEALAILQGDPAISPSFSRGFAAIKPFLESPPHLAGSNDKKEKESQENQKKLKEMMFAATDLLAALESRYFSTACNRLVESLSKPEIKHIAPLTGTVVSDLVSRGWELGELFRWHRKFLVADGRTFSENLEFLIECLKRPPTEFRVTLRISGGNNLRQLTEFRSFSLSSQSHIQPDHEYQKRFVSEDGYTVFAEGTFMSVDFLSAAIQARDAIEPLLDSLRFEFEPGLLSIDRQAFVTRNVDAKRMLVHVDNPVPNPVDKLDEESFKSFSARLATVLASSRIDTESKNRIETALRRYRFGRDSHNYSDKFLHWWMGLEALTSVGGVRIGRTVADNVKHVMLCGYLFRILRDLLITLKYLRIEWHSDFQAVVPVDSFTEVDVPGLIRIIRDKPLAKRLWESISNCCYVADRGRQVTEWITEPVKTESQLSAHLQRLNWHVDRLYRIRCCLVHGSPVRFRLALYSANLEFYLKQILVFTLNEMARHEHITDLTSLYQRNAVLWQRRLKDLTDARSANDQTIDEAVFASVVTLE